MNPTFTVPQVDWLLIAPVAVLLVAGVVGVLVEAFVPRRFLRTTQLTLALVALVLSFSAVLALWDDTAATGGAEAFGGSLIVDGPTLVLWGTLAVVGVLCLLVIADRTKAGEDAFAPLAAAVPGSDYEEIARRKGLQQTEVFPLALFTLGGMMIFPAAGDLLTLFIALEVLSLPLYILTGLARRRRLLSQEASLKYLLLGAYSSAFFLFGAALLYGFSGSVRFADIAAATGTVTGLDGLLYAGAVLILVGLSFKVGAVPFHAWTPDVYQGAPTPVTAFMAATTKVAAFGAMLRVAYVIFPALEWGIRPVAWIIAAATMVLGTAFALAQTDVKRMLAFSWIPHAGFVLVGLLAFSQHGITSVIFYLIGYAVATIGAFSVVSLVRQTRVGPAGGTELLGEATHLSQWAGLGKRHPWIASAFALFLLSFAGIPLTAGFAGKFAVFTGGAESGQLPLVVVGVLVSMAAAFFYIRVIVLMFFTDAPEADGRGGGITVAKTLGLTPAVVAVTAAAVLVLGVIPGPVLSLIEHSASFLP